MQLINYTPHPVTILEEDPFGTVHGVTGRGEDERAVTFSAVQTIDSAGAISARTRRIRTRKITVGGVDIPIYRTVFFSIDLPDPVNDVFLIVSRTAAEVADRHQHRYTADLLIPDETVRHPVTRQTIGCLSFARI